MWLQVRGRMATTPPPTPTTRSLQVIGMGIVTAISWAFLKWGFGILSFLLILYLFLPHPFFVWVCVTVLGKGRVASLFLCSNEHLIQLSKHEPSHSAFPARGSLRLWLYFLGKRGCHPHTSSPIHIHESLKHTRETWLKLAFMTCGDSDTSHFPNLLWKSHFVLLLSFGSQGLEELWTHLLSCCPPWALPATLVSSLIIPHSTGVLPQLSP